MRAIVRSRIINDVFLQAMGVTPEATLAGDVDTPEGRPFLNLKWGNDESTYRECVTVRTSLGIWVHHTPGDFDPINKIHTRLRVLLPAIQGVVSPDGSEVQVVTWLGNGPDVQDDGHRTIVKVGNYEVVGKV